jgi:hypothetical protein
MKAVIEELKIKAPETGNDVWLFIYSLLIHNHLIWCYQQL